MGGYSALGPGAFRLYLALAVFVSHVSGLNIGRPAVVLFFMLSGYWVTRLYVERAGASATEYLVDRVFRIWPLLALTAVATVALYNILGVVGSGNLPSTLWLLGLATRHGDVIGVAWSLDIELQFYLAVPVVLGLLGQIDRVYQPVVAAASVALLFAAGVAASVLGLTTVLLWSPAFAAGAAIFFARRAVSPQLAVASVVAFGGLMLTPWLRPLLFKSNTSWLDDPLIVVVCLTLVPFVAWNLRQPSTVLDRHLGNISFPFYLLHFPLVHAITEVYGASVTTKAIALAVSAVASIVVYFMIDRPLDRVRKTLVVRLSRGRSGVASMRGGIT